jgi:hypothetical protein
MPESTDKYKRQIRDWVLRHYPVRSTLILDVGPGIGTYAALLPEYRMDAVEVYEPYVDRFKLAEKYLRVYVQPVQQFYFRRGKYQLTVFGDVLEHISEKDAQLVLLRCLASGSDALVVVPYMYPQGASGGVEAEQHLQPDLTESRMKERYPQLSYLFGDRTPQMGSKAVWWAPGEEVERA